MWLSSDERPLVYRSVFPFEVSSRDSHYPAPVFMKVLVCDPVSPKGIALLQQRPEFKVKVLDKRLPEAELIPVVADVEAMVVRSETKVTRKVIESAPRLRVVGRAGVGVDNVD